MIMGRLGRPITTKQPMVGQSANHGLCIVGHGYWLAAVSGQSLPCGCRQKAGSIIVDDDVKML